MIKADLPSFGPNGVYIGSVDEVSSTQVRGWIANKNTGDQVALRLKLDNGLEKVYIANVFRSDLLDANIGNGCYSFNIDISKLGGGASQLDLMTSETNTPLPGSPFKLSSVQSVVEHIVTSGFAMILTQEINELELSLINLDC